MPQAKTTFFRQQDQAKNATLKLLFLFSGGVFATNFFVYVGLRFVIALSSDKHTAEIFGPTPFTPSGIYHDWVFRVSFTLTAAIVVIGSIYEVVSLMMNEDKVLSLMNAKSVLPSTSDPKERQLRNVIEEMAIASGLPVPRIFLMTDELGINAFACGRTIEHAAIAVTQGCLNHLSRDELQAVIGHEFSHILNGDVKLNIKLMGWVSGLCILVIIGKELAQRSNTKDGLGLIPIGLVLIVVGGVGLFFGKLIKAMISREREFLADASSVQFTRNPQALYDALKKVGDGLGSRLINHRAGQVDHMLLLSPSASSFMPSLDTHPPLDARLQALKAVGANPLAKKTDHRAESRAPSNPSKPSPHPKMPPSFRHPLVATSIASHIGTVRPENLAKASSSLSALPAEIEELKTTAAGAEALIATLLARGSDLDQRSFSSDVQALLPRAKAALTPVNGDLSKRLIVLNLALPAMEALPHEQRDSTFQRLRLIALAGNDWFPQFDAFILLTLFRSKFLKPRGSRSKMNDSDVRIFLSLAASQAGDAQGASDSFKAGTKTLGKNALGSIHPSAFRLDAVWESIDRLRVDSPAQRELLIQALESAVFADKKITEGESQLMRTLCLILGCPVPLSLES